MRSSFPFLFSLPAEVLRELTVCLPLKLNLRRDYRLQGKVHRTIISLLKTSGTMLSRLLIEHQNYSFKTRVEVKILTLLFRYFRVKSHMAACQSKGSKGSKGLSSPHRKKMEEKVLEMQLPRAQHWQEHLHPPSVLKLPETTVYHMCFRGRISFVYVVWISPYSLWPRQL